ncbi:DNA-directed RNA polymerase subunit beta (apicoplast) [Toxoplasma gondii TgCatPRC2]|uniref:DNA-directed RNA polymerase subunit beta n=9 Tax=Toxoplasma gondii TaxID=5811 RepID=A0A151G9Q6_TOXGO|nr:hypothetical protein TGME49_355200 [Toxoplasma gondii ME49]KAF4646402.1 hypothetical protein TGRH88_086550 [Toxoplasma gondii]KFG99151.1 DNA-directed RNA polymerase subunit beta [Toxoplasma gondii MAS]KYK53903.1 DNA-directed RNA polymerase subunit beta [Toxoplasma gondii TgCatPRC2]PIL95797.1 RNA polymerase B [Toxoplasma gondii COUG]PUA92973.1 DNA-directed RNA polymerase subunit beta [Toxoplasma gondii TgCATBr9]
MINKIIFNKQILNFNKLKYNSIKINFKLYYNYTCKPLFLYKNLNNLYINNRNYLNKYLPIINTLYYYKFYNLTKNFKINKILNIYDIYSTNIKKFIFFNTLKKLIQKNYFFIDFFKSKFLFIAVNSLKNLYFYNNNLINRNSFNKIFHRNFYNLTDLNLFPSFTKKNKAPKFKKLIILYKKYLFLTFTWICNKNWKYSIIFFKNFFFKIKNLYLNINTKIKDITFNLIHLDNIFETKIYSHIHLISNKTGILLKNFFLYEENTLNFIWTCTLFTLKYKKIFLYSLINQKTFYEQKYSIVWGNIILTNGVYSPNIFILKLFSNYLEYYSQYKAAKLAYIYTYYIIIESLIKQYHYNGILLPSLYFELLAKRMTNFVKIISSGEIMLTEENIISFNFVTTLNYVYSFFGYKQIIYKPIILGISKSILASSGFLATISFQETFRSLIKFTFKNTVNWLTDLKSKIIATDLNLIGTGWYRYFN